MKQTKRMWLKLFQFLAFIIISATASAQVKADFSATPVVSCPPAIVTFTDMSTGNPTSWQWDFGNGATSVKPSPTNAYFDPGVYTVKLIVKNDNGSIDTLIRTQYITINAVPTVNFTASDTIGCFPLKVKFSDFSTAGSGTIQSWQWDFGDGTLSYLQSPEHTYVNAGSFTVTLRVYNSNGCVKVFTRPTYINLTEGVKAGFTFVSGGGCASPTPVTFTNTTTGTGTLSYLWNFGDGNSSTNANPVNNYTTAGSYTVKLIAKNTTGCTDTLIQPNAINIGFVKASFTGASQACIGAPVTFTNTSTPNTVSATWYFSDGSSITDANATKVFNAPGTYQIKLVNDFGSCKDSTTKSITINDKPAASFTATNTTGCSIPLIASFQNTSTGGATYFWTFGDGSSTSTLQNPTHTYTAAGTYSIRLVVTNASGCTDTITKNDLVRVIPPRIVTVSGLPVRGCIPYSISPVAVVQSVQPVTSYLWDFGDGTTSLLATPSHSYTVAGIYTVKLKIITNSGCSDSFTVAQAVTIGNKPSAQFTASPRDICAEVPVEFTDLSTSAKVDQWYWTFGDGGSSDLQNPKHPYNDTGKFTVVLVVTSSGCSDTLKVKDYIHISPPIANFDTSYNCSDRLTRKFIDKSIGATSWTWDFGDGASSTDQNPTHTYAAPGLYTVILTVSNGSCQHKKKRDVKVVKEMGELTIDQEFACRNGRVVFNADKVDKANIVNYTWYFEGLSGTPVTTNNSPVAQSYANAGNYPAAVVTYDVLGCRDTLTAPVTIKVYGPKAGILAPIAPACLGSTITFTDLTISDNIHPITKYYWSYGDGKSDSSSMTPPFAHQYDTAGTFNVNLAVVDSYGCKDNINLPALVTITHPVANISISDTLVCPNTPVTLSNKSTGSGASYTWDFGDGKTSTTSGDQVHTYTTEGLYNIIMNMIDASGCTASASVDLKVAAVVSDFKMSASFSSCPPLLVDFTNQSKNFVTYSWDFGDGGKSNLNNPSHLYTYPGDYIATLTVYSNGQCSDVITKKITIQGPTGVFTYTPTKVCTPADVNFVATTKNAVRYFWDFNDGTGYYSANTAETHTYTTPGSYLPKLVLEDAMGCPVPIVGSDSIKVNAIETNILAQNRVICDSGFVTFADSTWTNDAVGGFLWEFGDGTTSTNRNAVHKYNATGWYNVKLTATSKFGCTDVATMDNYVKVISSPSIDISGLLSACEPAILNFSGAILKADTSTLSWNWDLGNGQTSNIQTPAAQTYPKAGDYPVKVTVVNSDGCTISVAKTATIHPIPSVDAGIDTVMCLAASITLQATGADTYTWDAQPTLSCLNCAAPAANPTGLTTYKVTGKTLFGCTNIDSITVKVKQPLTMTVGLGDTLCLGETYTLKASGAEVYQWSPSTGLDNPNSATPKANPASTVRYQVIGKDDKSCFADTGYVTLQVYPIPQIQILGANPRQLAIGTKTDLTTQSSPDVISWKWFPGTALSCTNCPSPTASPIQNITYTVQASNAGGCLAKDDVTIAVNCDNTNVYVPNSFSPNGDGSNDQFFPRSSTPLIVKSFKIFNRWGQVIFIRNNVNSNIAAEGWDGTMNGIKLTPDVYVYCIEVICQNSQSFPIIGNVTLVR